MQTLEGKTNINIMYKAKRPYISHTKKNLSPGRMTRDSLNIQDLLYRQEYFNGK